MKITGNCVVEVWRKRHERGRTKSDIFGRSFRRSVFSRLEIYQISMKNGEKSMSGRDAIIIGNGKHPVITV